MQKFFQFRELNARYATEIFGGLTTFLTMSYIIFVNPVILAQCGMDANAVRVATCVASALGTILMGILARYPIAQAPAMGHNAFFAFIVCGTLGYSWPVALGANFISGTIFLLLSLTRLWEDLVDAVPPALKHSIAVGIGLLIALIGMEYGGIVVGHPATLITLGNLSSPAVLVTLVGVLVTVLFIAMRIPGAILWGMLAAALVGIPLKVVQYHGLVSLPPSVTPTFLKLDLMGALKSGLIPIIFVFFFLDIFDTMGTLIGVGTQGGFVKNGKMPRANRAMLADALATVAGTAMGTSTVSSYIESATGIAQGARTGFANLVTGALFLVALFFNPLAEMFAGTYQNSFHPVVASPLIIVGYMMLRSVTQINWEDVTEAIPAFFTILIMPFTFSITEGIAVGFISYSLLKLVSGRGREVHWIIYLFAFLFVLRYILLPK
ncbi:NCS2 family permease [candidate division KSB1 bacterium]|nr:NCS2 family permease [candidate division KSB1 bacterium]